MTNDTLSLVSAIGDAIAAMVPGAVFQGAFQAADNAGVSGLTRDVFITLYLDELHAKFPRGVPCDRDNVIVQR